MKKSLVLIIFTFSLLLVGCGDNSNNDFAMKEKCAKYSEVAIQEDYIEAGYTLLTNFDKTHHGAVYNKELNTCLAYVEGVEMYDKRPGEEQIDGYVRRIVVDALTNQVLVDCNSRMEDRVEVDRFEKYDPVLTKEQIETFEHFKCYNQYHEYIDIAYY